MNEVRLRGLKNKRVVNSDIIPIIQSLATMMSVGLFTEIFCKVRRSKIVDII